MDWIRTYGKSIVAVIAAGAAVLASSLTDDLVTDPEKIQIAIAVCSAVAVYLTPNVPHFPMAKTLVAVLLAGLNAAAAVITDGISPAEWLNVALAAAGVLMVAAAPSRSVGGAAPPRRLLTDADA